MVIIPLTQRKAKAQDSPQFVDTKICVSKGGLLRMSDFWVFVKAVFAHYVIVGTGSLLSLAIWFWEHQSGRNVTGKVFIVVLGGFLIWAMFMAWRDQRVLAVTSTASFDSKCAELDAERARNTPDLHAQIDEIAMGTDPEHPNGTAVFLTVSVRNLGAPSVAEQWHFDVTIPGKGVFRGWGIHTLGSFVFQHSSGEPLLFKGSEAIQEKTAIPIPTGGMVRGFLLGIIQGVLKDQAFHEGTKIEVFYADVKGTELRTERTMGPEKTGPMFYPGLKREVAPPVVPPVRPDK